MTKITAMFWDVGGVLLSNGWDHISRRRAAEKFGLNAQEFESRHDLIVADFETGRLTLDEYLDRTLYPRPANFDLEKFKRFIFSESTPNPDSLALAKRIGQKNRIMMCILNNESEELNEYRIETFGLRSIFTLFVTSAYVSAKKPDARIYQIALDLVQRPAAECLFIDDRLLNVECAERLGMPAIVFQDAQQLASDLKQYGIAV